MNFLVNFFYIILYVHAYYDGMLLACTKYEFKFELNSPTECVIGWMCSIPLIISWVHIFIVIIYKFMYRSWRGEREGKKRRGREWGDPSHGKTFIGWERDRTTSLPRQTAVSVLKSCLMLCPSFNLFQHKLHMLDCVKVTDTLLIQPVYASVGRALEAYGSHCVCVSVIL